VPTPANPEPPLIYDYWPDEGRPPVRWPNGARVAFYVGVNLEYFEPGKRGAVLSANSAHLVPDPLNAGWRDYGPRVGVWRLLRLFDELGIRGTALLNSDCCIRYPAIAEAVTRRDWAMVAHGKNNSVLHTDLPEDAERAILAEIVETIERTTGRRPKGWLGPVLSESYRTPELLGELGVDYLLDWCSDDQPFPLRVPGRRMIGVPYSVEVNDITVFPGTSAPGKVFERMIIDQFDVLYDEGAQSGRVVALALHPFIASQPFRHPYLRRALEYIVRHDGVWVTTSDEIAAWYLDQFHDRDVAAIAIGGGAATAPGGAIGS